METCKNNDFFYNDNCSVRTVNRKAAVRTTYHVPHTRLSTLYTHTLPYLLHAPNLRYRHFTEEQRLTRAIAKGMPASKAKQNLNCALKH